MIKWSNTCTPSTTHLDVFWWEAADEYVHKGVCHLQVLLLRGRQLASLQQHVQHLQRELHQDVRVRLGAHQGRLPAPLRGGLQEQAAGGLLTGFEGWCHSLGSVTYSHRWGPTKYCLDLTLPMLKLIVSKAQGCKEFWKPSKPCLVCTH